MPRDDTIHRWWEPQGLAQGSHWDPFLNKGLLPSKSETPYNFHLLQLIIFSYTSELFLSIRKDSCSQQRKSKLSSPSTPGARQGPERLAGVPLHDTGLFCKKVPPQHLDVLELPPLHHPATTNRHFRSCHLQTSPCPSTGA